VLVTLASPLHLRSPTIDTLFHRCKEDLHIVPSLGELRTRSHRAKKLGLSDRSSHRPQPRLSNPTENKSESRQIGPLIYLNLCLTGELPLRRKEPLSWIPGFRTSRHWFEFTLRKLALGVISKKIKTNSLSECKFSSGSGSGSHLQWDFIGFGVWFVKTVHYI
jgi:hypothetical protein